MRRIDRTLREVGAIVLLGSAVIAQDTPPTYPPMPGGRPPPLPVKDAEASAASEMKRYVDSIPGTTATFEMVPLPGGKFTMGSPDGEAGRKSAEGPRREVELSPFWIGRCEVSWDEYLPFQMKLDKAARAAGETSPAAQDAWADAVSRPTPPYVPMDFGMGTTGFPAVSMTQFAARQYTQWLSMKTGRFYRLATEAEWEYACRGGSNGAYGFGDDVAKLADHAWFFDNSGETYHAIGKKLPNAFGLHDMHGNVAEWVLDRYDENFYSSPQTAPRDPLAWPTEVFPTVVRGGSFDDDPDRLRSAARRGSSANWQQQDPQLPRSIWYLTDAKFVGFRVVRPLHPPSEEEQARCWNADTAAVREIQARQRRGAR